VTAHTFVLPDRTPTVTRRARHQDFAAVQDLYRRSSSASRHARHLTAKPTLREADWHHLTDPDRAPTWLTHAASDPGTVIAATSMVTHLRDHHAHDLGLLIDDAWQSRSLGTALVRGAVHRAHARGARTVTATVHAGNRRMRRILHHLGARAAHTHGGLLELTLHLPVPEEDH